MEFIQLLLTTGVFAVIWKTIDQLIMHRLSRRSAKEDRDRVACEEQSAKRIGDLAALQVHVEALTNATKVNMQDRIKYLCRIHIRAGTISFDEREDILHMHEAYRKLGGNGHLDAVMLNLMQLQLSGE